MLSFCALPNLYLTSAFGEKILEAVLPNPAITSAIQLSVQKVDIPTSLQGVLKNSIEILYGEKQKDEVYLQISDLIRKSRMSRSQKMRKGDFRRQSDWYKDEIIYMVYAQGFGKKESTHYQNLKAMLPFLRHLGVTTLRIIPMPACRIERSEYHRKNVHKYCPGLESPDAFKSLIEAAHDKGLKIEFDLLSLPNPVATQDNDFQELFKGNELPLSSLYPLLERASYWSNQGIDIFNLDANDFFRSGQNLKTSFRNQAVVQLLSSFIQVTGPRSILHVEARQEPEKLLPYFGQEQTYTYTDHQKSRHIIRSTQGQIATHYAYTASLWSSLILGNNQAFWNAYLETPPFTDKETWAFFLRNQDELNLEMLDSATRSRLYEQLLPKGVDFQNGKGISGRLADFLDNNPLRIKEAFDLLLSLPGIPMIYYGDAIAARSNRHDAKQLNEETQTRLRKTTIHLATEPLPDSRVIHRAPIAQKQFYKAGSSTDTTSGLVYQHLQKAISIRQKTPALLHGQFLPVFSDERSVLSYIRYTPEQVVLVVHNLSDKSVQSTLTLRKKVQFTLESATINNLLTGKAQPIKQSGQNITLSLEPYQSYWLIL